MKKPAAFAMILTTVGDEATAQALAEAMVAARLAACVQLLPTRSIYRWQGRMEKTAETLLMAKTRGSLSETLTAFIKERHPYDIPEIVVLPLDSGWPPYLQWIAAETEDRP